MTKQIIWTKQIVEAFINEAYLNERQAFIVRTRAKGYTIAKQAEALNLSVDQVNKDIAKLKKIYDSIQPESAILPVRKKNSRELQK